MGKRIEHNDPTFSGAKTLIENYESFYINHQDDPGNKPEWNYLNAVFYCGTVFTTIGKSILCYYRTRNNSFLNDRRFTCRVYFEKPNSHHNNMESHTALRFYVELRIPAIIIAYVKIIKFTKLSLVFQFFFFFIFWILDLNLFNFRTDEFYRQSTKYSCSDCIILLTL